MPYSDPIKQKEAQSRHYQNNKLAYRDRNSVRREKLREWLNSYKGTLKCEDCPENRFQVLDFHHLERSKKDGSVSEILVKTMNKDKVLKEIKKCKVLCANCHRMFHWNEFQTYGAMAETEEAP